MDDVERMGMHKSDSHHRTEERMPVTVGKNIKQPVFWLVRNDIAFTLKERYNFLSEAHHDTET